MDTAAYKVKAEEEIRRLIDQWHKAVLARDLDGIVSHYAPDMVAYDAVGRLRYKGAEEYRRHWEACFAMCADMTFELHDVNVVAGDDVAFCYSLSRCGSTDEKGEERVGWMRATVGYRRIGGRWQVVHEHVSAPFDPATGQALFHLEP